ncbi:MAG TPA: DCC1-like thiol-disulfide oxidoreductase family protein [Terriglobia bacterium]|nr:DCC1-like thiol-disulfide oxidoreductase family protein [Terriglobia bacterium]
MLTPSIGLGEIPGQVKFSVSRSQAMGLFNRIRSAAVRAFQADEVLASSRDWTVNLAIFRIVFLSCGALPSALTFLSWTKNILPGITPEMWAPVSFYRLLPIGLIGNLELAQLLAVADLVLIVLGIVGFWTRSSIGLATLISLYGFGLKQNLGKIDHIHDIIWFMALLAASPSGHFFSMDAIIRAVKNADGGNIEQPPPGSTALWTLRYTWLMIGALYLGTGIAKLQSSLVDHWAGSVNLRNIMWRKWLELCWYDPSFGTLLRADSLPSWILGMLGASVVVYEIGFIFVVLFRKVRPAWGLWGLAFHIGNGLVLKIWFTDLMPAYVTLFDWVAMVRFLSPRAHDPLLVLYDEGCELCRRTVAILKSIDLFDVLRPVGGLSNYPARSAYPQLTDEMLVRDLYAAADGRVAAGYDAYVWIARCLFPLWPISIFMRVPFVAALGRRVYRGIADSRACRLPTPQAKQRAAIHHPEFTLIYWLGPLLLACQLGVSSLMLFYNLGYANFGRRHHRAFWLVNAIGRRQPVWPFDLFPTFTPATPSLVHVWEARWLASNGREIPVSPTAFQHVFASSGLSLIITNNKMLRKEDPAKDQARSLHLVRLLWQQEPQEIQKNIMAVNIYRVEYRLQSPENRLPGALVSRNILYTFPLQEFMRNQVSKK